MVRSPVGKSARPGPVVTPGNVCSYSNGPKMRNRIWNIVMGIAALGIVVYVIVAFKGKKFNRVTFCNLTTTVP